MRLHRWYLRLTRDYPCQRFVETVTEYLDETMPPGERARFARHLSDCPGCTDYLAQFRTTIELGGRITVDDVDALPPSARADLLETFRSYARER
jgi:anti-sigma factor RsiW